jgi:hypothetical protein
LPLGLWRNAIILSNFSGLSMAPAIDANRNDVYAILKLRFLFRVVK